MRRRIVSAVVFTLPLLLATAPAAAECILAPGLPGGGLSMSCDGSPPNPLLSPIIGTPNEDGVALDDGAAIESTPGSPSVDLREGDDTAWVGDGVVLSGPLVGGAGVDELIFIHTLSPAACTAAIAELEAADPAAGSITLEGLVYEWSGFETVTPDFECLLITEVPAMSGRGLLALGLLLAALGLAVLRARA